MKENIKIGLLGIIALTVVVNTFFMDNSSSTKNSSENSNIATQSIATNPIATPLQTNTPTTVTPPAQAPKQLSVDRAKTNIAFADMNHNFGTIEQDTKNTKIFTFTNTGSEPLIIEDAKGSCGCTVPVYPKEPIKPGDTGEIEVVYSPGKQQGNQNKTITITANTNPITTTLNISANVEVVK
ncbi:MAG: DUF1573 domain-containing protein [Vicingaceae bacterium]